MGHGPWSMLHAHAHGPWSMVHAHAHGPWSMVHAMHHVLHVHAPWSMVPCSMVPCSMPWSTAQCAMLDGPVLHAPYSVLRIVSGFCVLQISGARAATHARWYRLSVAFLGFELARGRPPPFGAPVAPGPRLTGGRNPLRVLPRRRSNTQLFSYFSWCVFLRVFPRGVLLLGVVASGGPRGVSGRARAPAPPASPPPPGGQPAGRLIARPAPPAASPGRGRASGAPCSLGLSGARLGRRGGRVGAGCACSREGGEKGRTRSGRRLKSSGRAWGPADVFMFLFFLRIFPVISRFPIPCPGLLQGVGARLGRRARERQGRERPRSSGTSRKHSPPPSLPPHSPLHAAEQGRASPLSWEFWAGSAHWGLKVFISFS